MTASVPRHAFVGRTAELDALERLLRTDTDRPPIVVIEGPAGSGKTTLVEEFLQHSPGIRAFRATAAPWEADQPYGILEQLGVRHPDGSRPEAGTGPVDQARRLIVSLRSRAGDLRPIVVVDGAEDADPQSMMALHSASLRSANLRIVLTARHPLQVRLPDLRRMQLSPLPTEDVRRIAQQAGIGLTEREARQLGAHTGGLPGTVIELLAQAPATTWADSMSLLPATRRLAGQVRDALAACPEPARALVEATAVLGDRCPLGEAVELAGASDDPVPAIDAATEAGLLRQDLLLGRPVLCFPEPMTRSAVLEMTPVRRTHQLHAAAAELVEDEYRALLHRVASGSVPPETLVDRLRAYAARQAAEGAWALAARALIEASRMESDAGRRTALLVQGVDALVGAGNLPEANLFVEELAQAPRSASVDATLAYVSILRGRPTEAALLLERAWQDWDIADPQVRAVVSARWSLHQLAEWNPTELVAWADRAIANAEPDSPAEVESAAMRGIGLAACGRWEEALAAYDVLVHRVPSGPQAQRIRMGRGWIDLARDQPVSARHDFEGAVPTRFRMGSTRISLWAQAWLARSLFQLGDWDEALAVVARAAREVADSEHHVVRPLVHWTGVQINALRGDTAAAEEHLRQGAASAQHYPIMQIPAALARAQFAESAADYDGVLRALAPLEKLLGPTPEPGFWPWPALQGNALVMAECVEEAREFVGAHLELAQARGHQSAQAALHAVLGRIRCGEGDLASGVASFDTALQLLAGLPLPYERARVNFSYAQSLRRAGRRREADAIMRAARDAYVSLGATAYVVRSERELKAAGVHTRRTATLTGLTPQETAVAGLVASGLSNREAAEQLYVSVKTVQFHLTRIYTKLGIRSRSELAATYQPDATKGDP